MALSKSTFFTHLKTLTPHHHHPPPPTFRHLRLLSFATPEEAAADRRRRKRRLRIEPPLHSLRQQSPRPQSPNPNPNSPKLPEPATALAGPRLTLHNRILSLIRANDLDEATLLTRHSIYSNCRPTIFTINAVLTALFRQSRFSDLLSLHRFITQAAVAPNLITHNLLLATYSDCRKTDTALEHYKQLINDAPFNPSKATYRILIKGLVDNDKLERALELKNEMLERGFDPDPVVYSYLMMGCVKNLNLDGVFEVFNELKEKLGGFISDGVVYGGLMKGYFLRGMEKEAMECYDEVVGENSRVKMSAIAFNSVLDALSKNGKFDQALRLFDRMMAEHDPPKRITVNLGSFNVIVDGYFEEGRFKDAIEVFRKMGEKRCGADVLSYNNLIEQLCGNGMLVEAEEIFGEMGEKGVNPDEFTYGLLMDACFKDGRADDAAGYFRRMFESGLRPNLAVYNRLVDGLVKVGKVDEAKGFFDTMVPKLKMDNACYEFIMNALFEEGKVDDVLKIIANMLRDDGIELTEETREIVKAGLRKVDRVEDLDKVVEEWEREKAEALAKEAEAAEKAKASAKAAVSSLIPSRLFGNKETEVNGEVESGKEESVEEVSEGVEPAKFEEVKSVGTSEQVTV